MPRSRRPHHHPREHTPEEYELIRRHYPYYKDDKIRLWDKLREKGYTRCYKSMLRVIRRMNLKVSPDKRKEYKPKPYAKAEYPGQKMQVDVKYVPTSCVVNGKKYYQYTAVDECARWCFREMYEEHSTASSLDFMKANSLLPVSDKRGADRQRNRMDKSASDKRSDEENLL